MSFPRYPAYESSGVEWLGELPAHWASVRLKRLLAAPLMYGANEAAESDEAGQPRFIRITDITEEGELRDETFRSLPFVVAEPYLLEDGDVLFARSGATVGKTFIFRHWMGPACFAGYLIRARVNERVCRPDWLALYCQSAAYWSYVLGGQIQATIPNVSAEKYNGLVVPVPPMSEQAHIAAFLHRETAKIDALVADQRRLMDLLREKRQAVITHAVTKGLNPDPPMKNSGVEWLGEVPAHWRVLPIRSVARLESGHTPSRQRPDWWVDCTVPWFSLADVWQIREAGADVIFETAEKVSELGLANSSARLLPAGTVMLSRTASVGFSAIMGVPMATTQDFANWVCGVELLPEYLLQFFRAMVPEFERMKMGSTHNTIYMPDLQAFRCALPPVEEQKAIVANVKRRLDQIDSLVAEARRAANLLQERRAALITAAVTGQIDVRGLALSEAA